MQYWLKPIQHALALICATQFLGACASTADVGSTVSCPHVESIKTLPFRGERGVDPSYDRLRFDDACEVVLIRSLDSVKKMADPRQMPPDQRFAVGDAALFVLLERRGLEVEAVVPAEVAERMRRQGIYAYFDYVATPGGRSAMVSRVKELIDP